MKKKLILATVVIVLSLLLFGIGKLYITYNLSRYAGYYVQHMPRRKGVKPELAVLIDNIHHIDEPKNTKIYFDLDGNGSIQYQNNVSLFYFSLHKEYVLTNFNNNDWFSYDDQGQFLYNNNLSSSDEKQTGKNHQQMAQQYLDEILPPILEVQKKPDINLQWLFNKKYEKRFN